MCVCRVAHSIVPLSNLSAVGAVSMLDWELTVPYLKRFASTGNGGGCWEQRISIEWPT